MFNVITSEKAPSVAPSVWLDRLADGGTGLELGFTSCVPRERIVADAHLIAAAPQLLRALLWALPYAEAEHERRYPGETYPKDGYVARSVELAREALAAAGVEVKP